MTEENLTLTINERLLLANQYLILEKLYPDEADSIKQMRTIVEKGYELHYNDLNVAITECRLTEEACREVMDILDMYRALSDSCNRLEEKEGIEKKKIQFDGFDGNDSSGRFFYARFLILSQGRWQEVLEGRPGFDLNSHSSVIEIYRRMLNVWNELGKKFDLTRDEIRQILDARIHPERRQ